ncbi:MAG: 16S rRNA (cytidine(1402)-2'-O)-methyltransferase [Gammaproteobacteria bacterium]|jgi:16S rRNA (cytidine1402-2'-O)-methyltransferase|nr:16S rRNA (cytidine(1402)-2'-O)-methyltransferase [Gammaproteobacteria bacterium]
MSGTLFIVATPIGNLEDLTPRASQTLAAVDLVAAEDTRHTKRLLSTIGAKPALMSLHDHNEEQAVHGLIESLKDGKDVALVSDAGTPLVSDPGYRLVKAAHEQGVTVVPIPGPSAVTAALSAAGLPTDRFCFEGFAPAKSAARRKWLQDLVAEERTLVMFESVHRIADCLADLVDIFGADRKAFIGRELTKMYEQCVQETLGRLQKLVGDSEIVSKGEFVIVIAGAEPSAETTLDLDSLLTELAAHLSAKDAARVAANVSGQKRNDMYQRLLLLKDESSRS